MLYLLSGSELVEFEHHQEIYTFPIAISTSKEMTSAVCISVCVTS
jgi:hypothetical protein